jgi:hypothetical protein
MSRIAFLWIKTTSTGRSYTTDIGEEVMKTVAKMDTLKTKHL